jgi:hypothetical protein
MYPGRSGRSLGERALNSGVVPAAEPDRSAQPDRSADPAGAGRPPEEAEGRHCWVRDPPEAAGTWPGLLVEWRRRDGGWQGRVAYTVTGPHGPALVEAWLPAVRLEPR